jgi:hypothetical protein
MQLKRGEPAQHGCAGFFMGARRMRRQTDATFSDGNRRRRHRSRSAPSRRAVASARPSFAKAGHLPDYAFACRAVADRRLATLPRPFRILWDSPGKEVVQRMT